MKKFNYKDKFYVTDKLDINNYDSKYCAFNKMDVIDNETNLLTPGINSKDKVQLKLNNNIDPNNYNLNYSNNVDNNNKVFFYYNNKDLGAGRGFGNLNISNDIRNGNASRNNSKELKKIREQNTMFDFAFNYIDKNMQDPNHIVMPIPRGGESTRKNLELNKNTSMIDRTFEFNY